MTIYTIICKNYVDKQRYNFRLFVLIHLSTYNLLTSKL